MKKHNMFYGILLTGLGAVFLLEHWDVVEETWWLNWPTILVIIGAAFTIEAVKNHVSPFFLPGLLFLLFGFHFHLLQLWSTWPAHYGVYAGMIGIALFLDTIKTKSSGWFSGLLLLLAAAFIFYNERLEQATADTLLSPLFRFFPFLILAAGLYFIIKRK